MIRVVSRLALLFAFSFSCISYAGINVYDFKTVEQEARFNHLVEELRCPKCQNNNLADSNAPIAKDLKDIVYEKIVAGQSDEQIIAYLKERYGDFISYKPPIKPSTWSIWYGPFVLLIIGLFVIIRYVKSRGQATTAESDGAEQFAQDVIGQWRDEVEQEQDSKSVGKNT